MTSLLAVFGNPVAHSRSPEIHEAFARQFGLSVSYTRIEAPLDGFRDTVRAFVARGAVGFNVTVPFKYEAFALADETTPAALASGTVNTMHVVDGRLVGSNTDGAGLVADLERNLGWVLEGRRILIVGAGGAVAGVLPSLSERQPASIDIMNRTHARAVELAERFGVRAVTASSAEAAYDLVISGSSAGLTLDGIDLPAHPIGEQTRCYDMIYSAGETAFNRWARARGAGATSDGLGMLVEQAAAAFNIWFDVSPDTGPVIERIRQSLGENQ